MMFTLSAPALAESTNALMQLSINSRSSIARLNEQNSIPENAKVLDIAAGDIKVTVSNGVQYVVQGDGSPEECSALVVSGESTQHNLTIKGGSGTAANVYLNNLKITSNEAAVSVSGDVVLIVEGESELHSGDKHAGVEKANDNGTLTITGSGKLSAYGGEGGAGIGGASGKPGNNITINGGTITASGKAGDGWGAGIGGGKGQGGSNITIRGGNVKAIPGAEAAGIGGGFKGNGTDISIEGGTVYAESGGGNGGTAAIGGGRAGGNGENIQITGGDITLKKAGAADIGIGGRGIEISVADIFSGTLTYLDETGAPDADKNIVKYGITVNGEEFNSLNKDKILNGALRYDPDTKTLSLNKSYTDVDSYIGNLTIYAPNTTVDLNGGEFSVLQGGKLVIEAAADVTLTSAEARAIVGDANITCAGKLRITCENIAVNGNLTVNNASSVELIGKNNNGGTVTGAAVFNDTGEVTIQNKDATKGAAGSISYSGDVNKYVYYTADGGALNDPRITPITANASYLHIVRSELHSITVPDGCSYKVENRDDLTNAHAGQTVTVTAPDKGDHFEFAGWTISPDSVTLTNADKLTATFTMPDGDVKLENSYNQLYDIKVENGTASAAKAKVDEVVTVKAVKPADPGKEFSGWKIVEHKSEGKGTFANADKETTTFTLTEAGKVTLKAMYMTPREITADPDTVELTKTDGQPVMTNYFAGDTVRAVAETVQGKLFDHWDITFGGKAVTLADIGLKEADLKNSPIEFKVPASSVNLTAVYKESRGLTLENATIVSVMRNGAIVTDPTEFFAGDVITVAPDNSDTRYQFVRWDVEGIAKTDLTVDKNTNNATFTMPDTDVKIHARRNRLFTATVKDGVVNGTNETMAVGIPGTEVTVKANVPEGEKFTGWAVNEDAPADFIAWFNALSEEEKAADTLTFNIPKGNVTLIAQHKTLHTVTVIDANGDSNILDAKFIEGDTVTVNAADYGIPADEFDSWESNDIRLTTDKRQSPTLTFKMVDKNVTLIAVPKTLFTITVTGGTVNGESTARVKAGDWVTIDAEDKGSDWKFIEWKLTGPKNFTLDTSKSTVRFQMPSGNVTLEAVQMKYRTITVNDGTVNGKTTITDALREQEVKIKAVYDPEEQVFDHWEAEGPDGWALTDEQKGAESFTLTVPKGNVTLTAMYKTLHTVTVINGTAQNGETTFKAVAGEKITLTPNLPDDQEFDCWYSEDINLNENQRSNPDLTFKMRDFDITIKAVPKQLYFVELADADTTANGVSGKVEVKSGEDVTIVAPEREGWKFIRWEVSDNAHLDDATASEAHFTMPSDNVSVTAVYYEYHTITMTDDKGIAYNEKGEEITRAVQGDVITIKAKDREDHEFNRWVITPDNGTLVGKNDPDEATFTMPDEAVVVDAKYKHLQGITVNGGAAYYMDGTPVETAKAGETIVIVAEDRSKDGLRFAYWEVNSDNVTVEGGEKATFEMAKAPVEITAHYEAQITYSNDPAIFDEGVGLHEDIVWEKVGDTVSITAVLDNSTDEDHIGTFPGMTFGYWEIVTPEKLNVTSGLNSKTITFEVPEYEVKLIAHWKDTTTVTPEEPLDPGFPVEPEAPAADGSGAVIGVAAAGAAIWGGYEITTRVILNDLLPEGAAIPTNRGELAMLIWTQKGKPEPAAEPVFTDVSDTELAKAAQWCVEQGLLTAEDGKFEPDGRTPKWRVIQVWNQAFPKE